MPRSMSNRLASASSSRARSSSMSCSSRSCLWRLDASQTWNPPVRARPEDASDHDRREADYGRIAHIPIPATGAAAKFRPRPAPAAEEGRA